MKRFATLLLAGVLALSLAVGASAVEGPADKVIKKGTPTLDGKLDEAYKYSLVLEGLGTGTNAYAGTSQGDIWNYSMSATVYALYDDAYLYLFADVKDDDVMPMDKDWCLATDNAIHNDCIEFRLSLNGAPDTIKVAVDCAGYNLFGLAANYDKFDYSTIEYKTTMSDTGFTAEIKIPCTKGDMDMIKAGKMGLTYQLNDRDPVNTGEWKVPCFTHSFQGEGQKVPVFYALSSEEAKAPASSTPTPTPNPGTTTPTPGTTTSPDTFDPAIIAVVLTAISGAAFVVISKKH